MAKSTLMKFVVSAVVSFCFSYFIQIHTFAQQNILSVKSKKQSIQNHAYRNIKMKIEQKQLITEPTITHSPQPSATVIPTPTNTPFPTVTPQPTAPPVTTNTPTPTQQNIPSMSSIEQATINLINQQRAAQNLPPLSVNDKLNQAARTHSEYMKSNNCFDHQCPGEADFCGRINASGYANCRGETIAAGQESAQDVVNSWMNSAGHRAILLGDYGSTGEIGISEVSCDSGCSYKTYWTADFGVK